MTGPPPCLATPDSLRAAAEALAAAAARAGFAMRVDCRPSRASLHALSAGSAIAALADRPAWEAERRPFAQIAGAEPAFVRVAMRDPARLGRNPPSVYVHPANPLRAISRDELARVLTCGNGHGDIVLWSQFASPGGQTRRIHVYGEEDDGGFITNLRLATCGARAITPGYEPLADTREAIAAVRDDPNGLAVIDEVGVDEVARLSRVSLADDADRPLARPDSRGDPLAPLVLLYLGLGDRGCPASAALALARVALSTAGQDRMATSTPGVAPLTPKARQEEIAKLEAMAV